MKSLSIKSFPRVIHESRCGMLGVLGVGVQFLVGPQPDDEDRCIIRGTMPPGVSVPMHSHKAVEVFFVLSGNIEVLIENDGRMQWVEATAGTLIEIPGNAKHAFRNRSQHPVINLLYTTSEHGRYFQEIGQPVAAGESVSPPTPDEVQRLLKTAQAYGYWFATPEENASVGITLL